MNEMVSVNEAQNDGKQIHLYFNGLVGLYTAYGYSAFILSKETKVNAAFSDNIQLPVVVINSAHIEELKEKLNVVNHEKGYYHLSVVKEFNKEEYAEWAKNIR